MCWSIEQPAQRLASSPLRTDGLQSSVSQASRRQRSKTRAELPESFYRFFADEVFSALSADVQQGLTTLAVAPMLDRELAVSLLGSDAAETVCAAALDVGLLVDRVTAARPTSTRTVFLTRRVPQLGLLPADAQVRPVLRVIANAVTGTLLSRSSFGADGPSSRSAFVGGARRAPRRCPVSELDIGAISRSTLNSPRPFSRSRGRR